MTHARWVEAAVEPFMDIDSGIGLLLVVAQWESVRFGSGKSGVRVLATRLPL